MPSIAAATTFGVGSAASATATVTKPTGAVSGDLLVMVVCAGASGHTWSAPNFTAVTAASGSNGSIQVVYRVLDGSGNDPGATFTLTADSSTLFSGVCMRVTGASTSTPFNPSATSGQVNSSGTNIPAASITTTINGDLLIWGGGIDNGSGTPPAITMPSGYTDSGAGQSNTTAGSGTNIGVACGSVTQGTAGATGTVTGTAASGHVNMAVLLGIAPGVTVIAAADTGSGAESAVAIIPISATDTGSGAEAATVSATISATDTGSGVETASGGLLVPASDTGTGTEAATAFPVPPPPAGQWTGQNNAAAFTLAPWQAGMAQFPGSTVSPVRINGIAVSIDATGTQQVQLTVQTYRQWLEEQLQYLVNKMGGQFINSLGTTPVATNGPGSVTSLPTAFSPALGNLANGALGLAHGAPIVYNAITGQFQTSGTFDPQTGALIPVSGPVHEALGQSSTVGQYVFYAGAPGSGSMIMALAGYAGSDQYGNAFQAGMTLNGAYLTGVTISSSVISAATITSPAISGGTWTQPTISGGTISRTQIVFDNKGGEVLAYAVTTNSVTINTSQIWTAPAGSTGAARIQAWGAGAGGGGGTSADGGEAGAGGEYAEEPAYPIVAGQAYPVVIGQGGQGGITGGPGVSGGQTSFNNNVVANGGLAGLNGQGGAPGSGSVNTIHEPGGAGGSNPGGASGGAGGGGSGGNTGAGGPGGNASGSTGAAGGAAGTTNGAAGGAGGPANGPGVAGSSPGAGGGGAGAAPSARSKSLSYTATQSYSYIGQDGGTPGALRQTGTTMWQGNDGGPTNGTQYSYAVFPTTQIQNDWSGYTITGCTVQLFIQHAWFTAGMYVSLTSVGNNPGGTTPHNYSSDTGATSWGSFWGTPGAVSTFSPGATLGTDFANGSAVALRLGPTAGNYWYGYLKGAGVTGAPVLTLSGYIGTAPQQGGSGANGQVIVSYTTGATLIGSWSGSAFTDSYGNVIPIGFYLPSQSAPAAGSAGAVLYGSAGHLKYVSSADSAAYATGDQRSSQYSQTFSSTSMVALSGLAATVAAGTYEYEAWVLLNGSSNSGATVKIQMTGPTRGNSAESLYVAFASGAGNVTAEEAGTFGTSYNVGTLNTTTDAHILIHGLVTFTASGAVGVTMGEGTSGDSFVIAGAVLRVWPIV